MWEAATSIGVKVTHVGPRPFEVDGLDTPHRWNSLIDSVRPTDSQLARLYGSSRWVAALRHVEGFELPAAEALACGCRPICFNQPSMVRWYGSLARYISDRTSNRALMRREIGSLLMDSVSSDVTMHERATARIRFSWQPIAHGFWHLISSRMSRVA